MISLVYRNHRYVCIFLICICLVHCLIGCTISPKASDDPKATNYTNDSLFPSGTGNDLFDQDPLRSIYFTCENVNMNIYLAGSYDPSLYFYIISRTPIDCDSVSVYVPIESEYKVSVAEIIQPDNFSPLDGYKSETRITPALNQLDFPFYLFLAYMNYDFSELYDLATNVEVVQDEQSLFELEELEKQYGDLDDIDFPIFHAYSVEVLFDPCGTTAERIEEITIQIGNNTYQRDIGSINLIPGDLPLSVSRSKDMYNMLAIQLGNFQQYYSQGIGMLELYSFTAQDNLTLNELTIIDGVVEVLDVKLKIKGRNNTYETYWDGCSPYEIYKGDEVTCSIIFRNDLASEAIHNIKMYSELSFNTVDGAACLTSERNLMPFGVNLYELYALVFDGVDLKGYYQDFYYPLFEPWRDGYIK